MSFIPKERATKHHYVPEFLLEGWAATDAHGQRKLTAYFWNEHKRRIWRNTIGVGGVCFAENSFTVASHERGKDAVETIFFAHVDLEGQKAHAKLLEHGPDALDNDQRSNFVRLLLSLEARQPRVIEELRTNGAEYWRQGFDEDEKIVEAVRRAGYNVPPSALYEEQIGMSLSDNAMLIVQSMTDNKTVGERILNCFWHVRHLGPFDGHLVLGDRPVVRTGDFRSDNTVWALPLTPKALFVCTYSRDTLSRIVTEKTANLAKLLNSDQALHATRYVFSTRHEKLRWLETRLRSAFENPQPKLKFIDLARREK